MILVSKFEKWCSDFNVQLAFYWSFFLCFGFRLGLICISFDHSLSFNLEMIGSRFLIQFIFNILFHVFLSYTIKVGKRAIILVLLCSRVFGYGFLLGFLYHSFSEMIYLIYAVFLFPNAVWLTIELWQASFYGRLYQSYYISSAAAIFLNAYYYWVMNSLLSKINY